MYLIKGKLDIEESLEKKIKSILKFLNIKSELKNGNIVHIKNTNLAYVEPHTLRINNTLFLFFNETENVR